jgi:hypothetical protein
MTYEYVPFKREPWIAAERKRLAAVIREEHAKNPKQTRERWFAIRRGYQEHFERWSSEGTAPAGSVGGLQELVR